MTIGPLVKLFLSAVSSILLLCLLFVGLNSGTEASIYFLSNPVEANNSESHRWRAFTELTQGR